MMNKIATLHFLCGKMASGKSTLAKQIASEQNALLLSEDIFLQRLYPSEIKSFEDYKKYAERLKHAIGDMIRSLLRLGQNIVLDFPANIPKTRIWIQSLYEETNSLHLLHYIQISDKLCLEQLSKRNQELPEGSIVMSEEDFHQITSLFVPPSEEEGFQIRIYKRD